MMHEPVRPYEIKSILPLIAESARAYENMPALYCGENKYTYGELDKLSGKLAAFLKKQGIVKGDVISVLVPRCEYMTIAPLGILRAGAAYQPLDPSYPEERLRFMIEDADAPVVIVSKELEHLITFACEGGKQRTILYMEDIPKLPDTSEVIWENVNGDDRFVILYTSGTTGVPKGIVLTHGNIYSACKWHLKYYEVDDSCRMAQHPSFVFDLAIVELLLPLTSGASIYIIPEEIRTDLGELNSFLEKHKITHLTMTTQLGRQFAMTVSNHCLRHLTVGGEALVSVAPPTGYTLTNDYGPAECTLYTTIFPIDKGYPGKAPIGRAVDEVRLYVVDEDGQEKGPGEIGELCIAGPHVALGYLNRPELTEKSFTDNPFSDDPEYKRMYHSGDLVIRHEDGIFEFMGRADRQVKIRGIRIEPAEIEELLRGYDGIDDVVISTPEVGGQRVIAAYYLADSELDTNELEDYVRRFKPSYMVPSFFIRIDSIPLNTNGKVDYEKLEVPDFDLNKAEYEAPANDTEKELTLIYEALLGITKVGRNDDFMRIGGDSLLAARLLFEIEKHFSCRLSTRDIMENSIVSELANLIEKRSLEDTDSGFRPIDEKLLPEQDYYPVSKAQERIYTAQKLLDDNDSTYILSMSVMTEKRPDKERTEAVLYKLFERHESLRTSFYMQGSDIVQRIQPADSKWITEAVEKAYTEEAPACFELEDAPLFMWSIGDKGLTFYWHHIINDGTGMAMFGQEFAALYNGEELEDTAIHQKEYASWEREWMSSDAYKHCIDEWIGLLSDHADSRELRLPYDGVFNESEKAKAGHVKLELGDGLSKEIEKNCRDLGVTPYMFFVTVFAVMLHKYTGKKRLILGTAVDGRQQQGTVKLQGMFANTLPIAMNVKEGMTFSQLLDSVRDKVLFMLDNRQASLEDISAGYEKLGGTRRTAHGHQLFDVFFVMRDFDSALPDMDGRPSKMYWPYDEMPMYDLTLEGGIEKDSYYFVFEYDRNLFDEESIRWMSRHFNTLLKACVGKEEESLSAVSMLGEEEKSLIMNYGAGNDEVFLSDTVIDRVGQQAKEHPDKKAVVYGESVMTYKQLWEVSGRIAGRLLKEYGSLENDTESKERWVGLIAGRGFSMIAAIFGILRSGAGYVPISPEYPNERISFMLKDSGADLVLVCDADSDICDDIEENLNKLPVIRLSEKEFDTGTEEKADENCRLPRVMPNRNAYMIYTSGSTGEPKGVVVEHAQLSSLLDAYKNIYELDCNDTVLQFANFVFDQSVWDIFHILTVGGCLCTIPENIVRDPERLSEYCEDKGVTVASLTPGFLRLMDPERLPKLRLLDVGGEAPDKSLLTAWSKNRTVFNTYGPTETTVNATSFKFADKGRILFEARGEKENVPIGRAIPGTRTYVLRGDSICGIGVQGELCISGRQVTRGYHNRPELTKEKYVNNPFGEGRMYRTGDLVRVLKDGNIEFISRIDDQVKIRGYRIETGEIEAAMRSLPEVNDAVVIIRKNEKGERQLLGYCILQNAENSDEEIRNIRKQLEKRLPVYMIPSVIIPVKEFKLTINGKIDRRRLPDPQDYREEFKNVSNRVLPATQEERDLLEAFEEVLDIKNMGVTDEFLSYGGDSIKAIMIVSLLRKKGYNVDAADILRSQTVRGLSAHIKKEEEKKYKEFEKVIPTPVMRMLNMAKMSNPSYYDQAAVFTIKESADAASLEQALNALVRYHGMLRMVLEKDGTIRIREKEEVSRIDLPVYSDLDEQERIKVMNDLNASIDPESGRIMNAALFREKAGDRLFLTFHHYVIDEVSWEIIAQDLNSLYGAKSGDVLPPMTVSFGEWSEELAMYSKSQGFIPEKNYWGRIHERISEYREGYKELLSNFLKNDGSQAKGSGYITASVGKEISDKLIRISGSRYKASPAVILLAGLVRTINGLYGDRTVLFQMESHGRGKLGKDIRCDRTVGWFTAVYPVLISTTEDTDEQIVQVKEELAAVPNYGLGYGLLFDDLVDIGGFVFNYLGSLRSSHGAFIEYSDEYAGRESDAENVDPWTISVNIRAAFSGFEIECVYDNIYSADKIEELINKYISFIESSIESIPDEGKVISPSDLCVSDIMSMRDWNRLTMSISPEDIVAIGTPTPLQKGMLYRLAAEPGTGAYMLQDKLLLKGEWNKDAFCASLSLAAVRFDALRIRFAINGYEKLWQIILSEGTASPEFCEMSGLSIEDIAANDLRRGFDPEEDVMLRVTFNADSADRDLKELLITSHHCIFDGWSFRILIDTVTDYYFRLCGDESYDELRNEALKGAAGGLGFAEYLRLTGDRDSESALTKWEEYLSGINEGAGIGESAESEGGGEAAYVKLFIQGEKEKKIREYAKNRAITLSTFFGTVFGLLLGFENDMKDIVFGETVSGRNINAKGIEDAVGMLINTIPTRIKWEADTPVSLVMKGRQEDYLSMQPYENAPLDKIMSRKKAGTGLIKTLYVYENYPAEDSDDRYRISMEHEEVDYPFSIGIEEQDGFSVEIQYDETIYERAYIDRLLGRYENLILQIISNEDIKISELERVPQSEISYMLSDISGTCKEFGSETFIHMLYENVKKNPDKAAVIMEGNTLSYGQLWRGACTLASKLGFGEERFVAVYADRNPGMIVALIASFIAGAAYVPLDPEYPDDRISFILSDCEPVAVLRSIKPGTQDRSELFNEADLRIIDVCTEELISQEDADYSVPRPESDVAGTLAYMIYTSGTTGIPKGVEIDHEALTVMVRSNREFFGDTTDVILQMANYVFDASVYEIFVPLAYGGTVCMISKEKLGSSEAIARYCKENKVTCIATTNAFLQALNPDDFETIDAVCAGGDAANNDIFAKWVTHARLMVNDYGPTEACVNALSYKYEEGHLGAIPIGRPYVNKKVYILQGDKLCGTLQKGEICIGGMGLARGYHNREELNSKAFVINPYTKERIYRTGDIGYFDAKGDVYCQGRYDDQVKIRGYRIETGEIESRIREFGSVREAAVISRSDNGREAYLAAYITCDEAVDTDMLRAYLKKKLPAYMVPVAIVTLDSLPRNASDKLDTDALPVPEFTENKAEPEGYLEEMIAALYEKILGMEKVGRDDSFFELGGSSLDMMRLISELNGYNISISDVAKAPTPRLFGELLLERYRGWERRKDEVALLKEGSKDKPALFCIPPSGGMPLCYLPLIKELDYDGRVYGLTDDKYALFADMTLEELMAYEPESADMWGKTIEHYYESMQGLFKDGDIIIGYSQGGPAAFLAAQRLESEGFKADRIIMLEAPEPGETYDEESKYERMSAAAAIFAGRTETKITDPGAEDSLSERTFFEKYLKENFGDNANDALLHAIFETYLVYSSNVMNSVNISGKVKAEIDSVVLCENGDMNEGNAAKCDNDPWSSYSQTEGEAYIIGGPDDDHLAFLSKYKKQISQILKTLMR
ncbi:non-ribosomal peptide synthetase [Butyrivibrio sp. ob235]|uniref:non-ribosomal peptide synthetase n=1 Tax=Butyrivibrio sp. ob235 TaxID=1761780 RepID=UPI000B85A6DB|nr:non-ribosomal peptide synthetase [Butyrivibrio sp. ob235]